MNKFLPMRCYAPASPGESPFPPRHTTCTAPYIRQTHRNVCLTPQPSQPCRRSRPLCQPGGHTTYPTSTPVIPEPASAPARPDSVHSGMGGKPQRLAAPLCFCMDRNRHIRALISVILCSDQSIVRLCNARIQSIQAEAISAAETSCFRLKKPLHPAVPAPNRPSSFARTPSFLHLRSPQIFGKRCAHARPYPSPAGHARIHTHSQRFLHIPMNILQLLQGTQTCQQLLNPPTHTARRLRAGSLPCSTGVPLSEPDTRIFLRPGFSKENFLPNDSPL